VLSHLMPLVPVKLLRLEIRLPSSAKRTSIAVPFTKRILPVGKPCLVWQITRDRHEPDGPVRGAVRPQVLEAVEDADEKQPVVLLV
jgi:hypothetical protein